MTEYQIYYLIIVYIYINTFVVVKLIKSNTTLKSKIISMSVLLSLPFVGYFLIARKYDDEKVILSSEKTGMIITAIIFYGFIFLLLG